MPNGVAFDDAVHIARENSGLGIGVHVSLVGERCIAAPGDLGGLVDRNGMLPRTYRAFIGAFLTGRFGTAEIRTEIQAQIAKLLDAGIVPTHIDFHQHLHMLPAIFPIALSAAQSAGIKVIRIPLEHTTLAGSVSRRVQARILRVLCRRSIVRLAETEVRTSDYFHGFQRSGNMNEANLLATLDCLKAGLNEVMMHPGFHDAATAAHYKWAYCWEDEYRALISPRVRHRIEESNIRLANFASVLLV